MVLLSGIPISPSLNMAYPTDKHTGGRFKSKQLMAWEKEFEVWALVNHVQLAQAFDMFHTPLDGHVMSIRLMFHFEWAKLISLLGKPKKLDLDNRLKIVIDSVTKVIGCDDSQIFHIDASKRPTRDEQKVGTIDFELTWMPITW
jgi:Holliday junction resolvase RusA-like endonuclease